MDSTRVRQLLEKYYEGQTSFEEENQLKSYFEGDVPAEFEVDKELFAGLANDKNASMLNSLVDNQEETGKGKTVDLHKRLRWTLRIAAVLVLAFTIYMANHNSVEPVMVEEKQTEMEDTYENPELAYLETKKALLYLSAQLNKGTDELKNISKINQSIEQLTKLSEIDKARKMIIQNE